MFKAIFSRKNVTIESPKHDAESLGGLLHFNVFCGRLHRVQELVKQGADVNYLEFGRKVPIYEALVNRHPEIAVFLAEAGADVNLIGGVKCSYLSYSINKGYYQAAKVLAEHNADVNFEDQDGKLPMDYLLSTTNISRNRKLIPDLFKLMMAAGATVDGATATISPLVPSDVIRAIVPEDTLFWLAANNDAPMLAAELAGGLDPNMKTENGMTLLHWACAGDAPECVQLLLDAGAVNTGSESDFARENDDDDEEYQISYGYTLPTPAFFCMHESSDCLKNLIQYENDYYLSKLLYCGHVLLAFAIRANSLECFNLITSKPNWKSNIRFYELTEDVLKMRPVPVEALRALLAAAGERVRNCTIHNMPLIYHAVDISTVDAVRLLVEGKVSLKHSFGWCEIDSRMGEVSNPTFKNVLEFAIHQRAKAVAREASQAEVKRLTEIIDYLKTVKRKL